MERQDLAGKLERFPRFPLLRGETPLHPLEKTSRKLSIDLRVKRDDLTGLAAGGNKTRKLEFLIGRALDEGADTVLTAGWYHSNHALQTAAAAGRAGLKAQLFLKGEERYRGSLFLDRLTGADIRLFDVPGSDALMPLMERQAEELRAKGHRPFVIPVGGSNALGALGYVQGGLEIADQCLRDSWQPDFVILPTSSGGTHAGLFYALRELLPESQVIGIGVGDDPEEVQSDVEQILHDLDILLENPPRRQPAESPHFRFDYGFGSYGSLAAPVMELIARIGTDEGLYLDPVYTGKAFYGLIDLMRKEEIQPQSRVLFLHTGGLSGLFQYEEEVIALLEQGKRSRP